MTVMRLGKFFFSILILTIMIACNDPSEKENNQLKPELKGDEGSSDDYSFNDVIELDTSEVEDVEVIVEKVTP